MENLQNKDFYTVDEVAEILNVTRNTVYFFIRNKKLNAVKMSRKLIRVKREDLEEFIKRSKSQ